MAEVKLIPTRTATFRSGSEIRIKTSFDGGELPNTLSVFVANVVGIQDSVPYVEGDCVIEMKNFPANIDYVLDSNGSVVVFSNAGDVDKYSINNEGELIYEE